MSDDKQVDVTSEKMPEELKTKLENLSPFSRRYAEYRAKGLKQADAAEKAGSNANGRGALGRVGWNTEQLDGVKEYILWLEHKRAKAAVIDDLELVDNFREVYRMAMADGKYSEANKALEHLGNMIGAFAFKNTQKEDEREQRKDNIAKNNTSAFTQDLDEHELGERASKLQKLMEQVKKDRP